MRCCEIELMGRLTWAFPATLRQLLLSQSNCNLTSGTQPGQAAVQDSTYWEETSRAQKSSRQVS